MKIELTRAEIERIILAHLNALIPGERFNAVEPGAYRTMPDSLIVSYKAPEQESAE
jgi:hypothetical protein